MGEVEDASRPRLPVAAEQLVQQAARYLVQVLTKEVTPPVGREGGQLSTVARSPRPHLCGRQQVPERHSHWRARGLQPALTLRMAAAGGLELQHLRGRHPLD